MSRTGNAEIGSVPILTSDVYEWVPGGFFVVHSAFGKIGETSVGGVDRTASMDVTLRKIASTRGTA